VLLDNGDIDCEEEEQYQERRNAILKRREEKLAKAGGRIV
jgi:hypothetical protein